MPDPPAHILRGTLDLLILRVLGVAELHGLGIADRIAQVSNGAFQVKPGSLFPALHRMEEAGWLASHWGDSDANRKAKYYKLTKAGRKQLEAETAEWNRVSLAVGDVLKAT